MRARPGSKGLSPKENRDVPPLDYGRVYRVKARRPELEIVINGGIDSLDEAAAHLAHVDGVMLGRAAYADPYLLAEVDRALFGANGDAAVAARRARPLRALCRGASLRAGARLNQMTRHILGLFHGQPRARAFRRHLAENAHLDGAGIEVLLPRAASWRGEHRRRRRVAVARSRPISSCRAPRSWWRPSVPGHDEFRTLAQLVWRDGFLRSARASRP